MHVLWRPALKIKMFIVALIASTLALTPLAKADSISLANHTGNTYTYNLVLDSGTPTMFLFSGFELSGLSNVTNAVLSGQLANDFSVSFDADSVNVGTIFALEYRQLLGTLTITSLANPGLVNYSIVDSNGAFCGQVLGPNGPSNSPVPEPSSLILLGSGLLAGASTLRKKLFA